MGINTALITLYVIGCIHHTLVGLYSLFGLDFSGITDERLLDLKVNSFRYITTWNFLLQTGYFYLALACEIIPLIQNKAISKVLPVAKISKGSLFSGIIFPSAIYVTTLFWTLNFINKDYTLPPGYEKVLPLWLNHCIHTNILYLVVVEIALGQLYSPRYLITFTVAVTYCIIYTIQYMALYFETGRWLYGIMYFQDNTQRIVFLTLLDIYAIILSIIGHHIVKRKTNKFVLTDKDKQNICGSKNL